MLWNIRDIIQTIWLIVGAVWLLTAFRLKPNVQETDSAARLFEMIILVCAAILMFSDTPRLALLDARYFPASPSLAVAGIGLVASGAAFAIIARIYLGQNWSAAATIKRDHELVRRGPYCLVRHPIYTGQLVAAIGTAIAFGQVRDLMALPLMLAAFWLKADSEERLLLRAFGDRYMAYRRQVRGAIIPHVL
jgi:protein-S-isoprenylcysteine O-methyltransferase Ste14